MRKKAGRIRELKRMKKFWIVLVEGARLNKSEFYAHHSEAEACKEAARLARKEKVNVIVMEAIHTVQIQSPEPPLIWTDLRKEGKDAETKEDCEDY